MQSFREPATATPHQLELSFPIPTRLILSLASAPLLVALVSSRVAAHSLIQLGISSEELFRGDRLPPLPPLKSYE
ncbi:MAG: hypothetical protein WA783_12820 [Phormidesmis sp.]